VIQGWFNGTKQSLLKITADDLADEAEGRPGGLATLFFLALGLIRMGRFESSAELIDLALKEIDRYGEKTESFSTVVNICYALCLFADYYLHLRDMDVLQKNHPLLRRAAQILFQYCARLTKVDSLNENSLENNFAARGHSYDLVLLACALDRFAYLSRAMGIFGDEKKFEREAKRMTGLFVESAVLSESKRRLRDDFYCYSAASVFPLTLAGLDAAGVSKLLDNILSFYGKAPILVKSMGIDVQATLFVLNNMICVKDHGVGGALVEIMNTGGSRYELSDYVNPLTGHGCWGRGSSKRAASLLFCTLRNLLFLDVQDRLELFPVPDERWFTPGADIVIDKAPSRFGSISLRVVTTANEVHILFEALPKYVPPDIMINLPFKARIVKDDDFVIKKEWDSSFLINGWPALIRFMKK
jgi:hypothetical protein